MIKKLVVMAVLLSLVLPVNSQAMTGVFMLQKCEAADGTSGRLACAAYMSGTVDALGSITGILAATFDTSTTNCRRTSRVPI